MRILITGICGFVGSALAAGLRASMSELEIIGLDNLSRAGSETNRISLRELGVKFVHGDVRCDSDFISLPATDWVIDAAANPAVMAGLGRNSSRQLLEQNVFGTVHLLEYCRRHGAGLIFLSSSRVYSIKALQSIPLETRGKAFALPIEATFPTGLTRTGITENFSTDFPRSLYGTSKLVSEQLALEYGAAFQFPVWIDRCGILAGPGQFGHAEQGILSFWVHASAAGQPLVYIGFGGEGLQVRDYLHPRDLVPLLLRQLQTTGSGVFNVAGGLKNSMSLTELNAWCAGRFGSRPVAANNETRPFDVPWLVLDSEAAKKRWDWQPQTKLEQILEETAAHAEANPRWLERTSD